MVLKILTGCIAPNANSRTRGTATIDFDSHSVTGDATGSEMETLGPRGKFKSRPGKILALREFIAQDRRKASEDSSAQDKFEINDSNWNNEHLVVSWGCESGAQIVEISYLIVGEA